MDTKYEGFPERIASDPDEVILPFRIGIGWVEGEHRVVMRIENKDGGAATVEIDSEKTIDRIIRSLERCRDELRKITHPSDR